MKLRKGNLHIAEIKRNSKIMEDASTEIIEHRCIEWNIVKKIVPITKPHFVYWHLNNTFTCKCKHTLFLFAVFVCAVHQPVGSTRASVAVITLGEILSNFVLLSVMFTDCKI